VELELKIFQTAAILEVCRNNVGFVIKWHLLKIIHCMVGLVRSPVGTTLTQVHLVFILIIYLIKKVKVFSRVTVLWLILYKIESVWLI
jgi:hypothetical protein